MKRFGYRIAPILVFCLLTSPMDASAALLNATGVLGQGGSYTTRTVNYPVGSVNARGFKGLNSLGLDRVHHRLFTSESYSSAGGTFNYRLLVFQLNDDNTIATDTPSYVLGACDFNTAGANLISTSTIGGNNVTNLYYDSANDRLFVSVAGQHRVLGFDVAPERIQNCEDALFVIGQPNFTSHTIATSRSVVKSPDNVTFDTVHNRLFVAESGSHRVSAFSVPPGATSSINGEDALFVLGQPDFTSNAIGYDRAGMNDPTGIRYDPVNDRLFVSDLSNNRILVYSVPDNADESINGEDALFVLGQTTFTASTSGATQSLITHPDDLDYDVANGRLFANDLVNNRMLIWNIPANADESYNGAPADNVINQSTWTGRTAGLAQNRSQQPEPGGGFDPDHNAIYIYEIYGARLLYIPMIHITNSSALATGKVGVSYSQALTVASNSGTTTTYSLYSGTLPDGLTLNPSNGVISGTPTAATTSTVRLQANDTSVTGNFFDRQDFSITIREAQAPSVALTGPSEGGTVRGSSVNFAATASDDTAIAGVTFYVNGVRIGAEDTSEPYSATWNSLATTSGAKTIVAVARDTADNYATSTVANISLDNDVTPTALSTTPSDSSATVEWSTEVEGSSRVFFGVLSSLASSTPESDAGGAISHSVSLRSLLACTAYQYVSVSKTEGGDVATSSAGEFKTTGCTGDSQILAHSEDSIDSLSGGTLSHGSLSLSIPAAFSVHPSATFQASTLDPTDFFAAAGAPSGLQRATSSVYHLSAYTDESSALSSFDQPITVTMSYADGASGLSESSLSIYRYDSSWQPLTNCSVDTSAKEISCETTGFSDFAIFGSAPAAASSSGSSGGGGGGGTVVGLISAPVGLPAQAITPTVALAPVPSGSSQYLDGQFWRTLYLGMRGADVLALQRFLNRDGFLLAKSGPGAPGEETDYFGTLTYGALVLFQEAHAKEILEPLDLTRGTGVFGAFTRSFIEGN